MDTGIRDDGNEIHDRLNKLKDITGGYDIRGLSMLNYRT
jgi:ribosomal protein S6E (S10)